ncbi:MAG: PKD domain-containing protein [Pirellulales bacterium]
MRPTTFAGSPATRRLSQHSVRRSTHQRRRLRTLWAESLEARRVMAADLLPDVISPDLAELAAGTVELQRADGYHDLSHLVHSAGNDVDELARLLREAESQHLDHHDDEMDICDPQLDLAAANAEGDGGAAVLAAAGEGFVVPVLNSLPGATASIYLDFDGHFESVWGSYSNVVSPPLDRDGDPATLNADELAFIHDVWAIVAEDFATLKINVTTVEPPQLAPGAPAGAADGVALRLAIGGTHQVLNASTGIAGMAYINAFTTTSIPNVAYVFPVTSTGANRSASTIGSIASHEAGHSFGLRHVPNAFDLANDWQGIMNASSLGFEDQYWLNWNNELGAPQDELAILASSTNGFGYRADDHGGTTATASNLTDVGGALSGAGVIGVNQDVDVWRLPVGLDGAFRASVQGAALGQNLDAVIDLLDAGGNVVATADPGDSADAELVFDSNVARYLRVRSTGAYGRVGQYTLTVEQATPSIAVAAPSRLLTSETGASDSATVRLNSRPTSDVVVNLSVDAADEATVSPTQLVFTPSNWYLPQGIVVQGVDDSSVDGPAAFAVTLMAASTDPAYDTLTSSPILGINADDDRAGWARQLMGLDGPSTVYTVDIQATADGGFVALGSFTGTVDFAPESDVQHSLSSTATRSFLARYSPAGTLLWIQTFGVASGSTIPGGVALDDQENVYIVGSATGPLTIGSTTLANAGSNDAYLARFSAQGDFAWAKSWGGVGSETAVAALVDASGDIVVTGVFAETVDFDPGAGTTSRTSAGGNDVFVAKFSNAGAFRNVATFGGSGNDNPRSPQMDDAGNLYLTGYFVGETQIGGQTLTSVGSADAFLVKLSPAGDVVWVRQIFGDGASGSTQKLSRSPDGTLYVASIFADSVHFGPGTPSITSAGANDVFLARWDANGTFLDVGQVASTDRLSLGDLDIDAQGRIGMLGRMYGATDLDPSSGTVIFQPQGDGADFVLRLAADGQLLDTVLLPTTNSTSVVRNLSFDVRGNVLASGQFSDAVVTPTGEIFRNDLGSYDSYLLRLAFAPGVTVTAAADLRTSENGGTAAFSVVLDTPPASDVVVQLAVSDVGEGALSTNSLVFTPTNWRTPQTVVVAGVDDSLVDGDQSFEVTLASSSSDSSYTGLPIASVSIANEDNDAPIVLFADSFEVAEWNGLWVEDSQNDWYLSTQRATQGTRSAEVDGSAVNATLAMATGVNASNYGQVTLTFDWLIESGFDAGEFLSLDVSTNGGASWTPDVRRLNGNSSPENVWHATTVDLTPYASSNLKVRFRSTVSAADEDANVDNVRITGIPLGPNASPVAQAGGPYAMNEGGSVQLTAALSSDPDGQIVGYAWDFDGDGAYDDATGVGPSFTTTVSGVRTLGLQVTDNRGASATTTVVVNVANVAPTANAGADQSGFTGQPIALSAAGSSDPGNDIASYAWDFDADGQYDDATGVSTSFLASSPGVYVVGLRVTDADGASSTDQLLVSVANLPAEVVLFEDSFEVAEWNGLWVEDAQNDWYRSTQRATQGTRSAEVDGLASNATLSLANSVSLAGQGTATLTFDWLIESGFDAGEYLALDVSTNGGVTWTLDVRRLSGNVSPEDKWVSETVDLSPYASSSAFKLRFRSLVSDANEDANVDNVRLVANPAAAAAAAMAAASVDEVFASNSWTSSRKHR